MRIVVVILCEVGGQRRRIALRFGRHIEQPGPRCRQVIRQIGRFRAGHNRDSERPRRQKNALRNTNRVVACGLGLKVNRVHNRIVVGNVLAGNCVYVSPLPLAGSNLLVEEAP
jgi:hypothetical protein